MHLTREAIDAWAADRSGRSTRRPGNYFLRLEEGDSMPASQLGLLRQLTGPAIVELVVYRDGGWSARELTYETVESIALAASLAQRSPAQTPRPPWHPAHTDHRSDRWMER